jgi:serine acetyltransferase
VLNRFLYFSAVALIRCKTVLHSLLFRTRLLLVQASVGKNVRISGRVNLWKHPRGILTIGDGLRINSGFLPNPVGGESPTSLYVGKNSELWIGNEVGVSSSTIVCLCSIRIGDRVLIGGGCTIVDSDFHAISPTERIRQPNSRINRPVTIEEDVFIGCNTTILKGVTIGRGAVVGAGAVVSKDIPAMEIWAGNPCRKIGDVP